MSPTTGTTPACQSIKNPSDVRYTCLTLVSLPETNFCYYNSGGRDGFIFMSEIKFIIRVSVLTRHRGCTFVDDVLRQNVAVIVSPFFTG